MRNVSKLNAAGELCPGRIDRGAIGKKVPSSYVRGLMRAPLTLLFTALLVSVSGCGGEPPPGDPPPASFADYYAGELFLRERTRLQEGGDSLAGARIDSLRQSYGITERGRDSLLAYCQASLPRWEAFLGDVLARLDAREKAARSPGSGGASKLSRGPAGGTAVDAPAGRR